ncbi:MAG: pyruvate kinase [Alphaproteobacteria bacterium]|nr:pyruvate kinase [Alphaproteobacteria bacterium]
MRRARSTKIVATLGPASGTVEMIGALFDAGVDVFRLNFSHGTHAEHKARYDVIRAIERERKRPIGILMDLQGPKLRVGTFVDGKVTLKAGQAFRLDLTDRPGDQDRAPLPHPEIFEAIEAGTDLLLDDGRIRLHVEKVRPKAAETVVVTGGVLSNRKGVNVPGVVLPLSALTTKDRADLRFGLDLGVDWVALSFVQRPDDVAEARRLIGGRAAIMVKLEKPQAIERLTEILDLTDAVMVARGDLGVELPPEDVPGLQKRIVRACRVLGKPVVVATQMLESMVQSPAPTRAEASDVATAVYDGADAVMLSAETAAGAYPLEAVRIMDRIIVKVEHDPLYRPIMDAEHSAPEHTAADAITAAAAQVAQTIGAAAICTYTTSGSTTLRAARERPTSPILGLTANLATARRLAVLWGVHWVPTRDVRSFADMVERACKVASQEGMARAGDRLVITAGVPFGTPGATNILRIAWVE